MTGTEPKAAGGPELRREQARADGESGAAIMQSMEKHRGEIVRALAAKKAEKKTIDAAERDDEPKDVLR